MTTKLSDSAQHAVTHALNEWAKGFENRVLARKLAALIEAHRAELNGEEIAVLSVASVRLNSTPEGG